ERSRIHLAQFGSEKVLQSPVRHQFLSVCVGMFSGGFRDKKILGQPFAQHFKRLFGRVRELEQLDVFGRDGACVHEDTKVEDTVPVFRPIDYNGDFLRELLCLRQGQNLKHLVESSKAARKNNQCLRQIGKPQLSHEEVMKLEVKRR